MSFDCISLRFRHGSRFELRKLNTEKRNLDCAVENILLILVRDILELNSGRFRSR